MNILCFGLGVFATLYTKDKQFREEANKTVKSMINEIKGVMNDTSGSK